MKIWLIVFILLVLGVFFIPQFLNESVYLFKEKELAEPSLKIIFVGDIMLDRGVEYQIGKYKDPDFPFRETADFLKSADILFGNLEGPIVAEPSNFSSASLRFAFSSSTAKTLQRNNFDILSLANNHTLNMGETGLEQTREFLRKSFIKPLGDPIGCEKDYSAETEDFVFVGFNKTFEFNCLDQELVETVSGLKEENPNKFLIVSIHWGVEYQPVNSSAQKELAHKLIDAGADLIIGHHPHVVQNIEEYEGKLIFYSLGNFVFDQYFSESVKTGLAVELEVNKEEFKYRLYPVYTSEMAQPSLMQDKDLFLEDLAQKSSLSLKEEIERGIIGR